MTLPTQSPASGPETDAALIAIARKAMHWDQPEQDRLIADLEAGNGSFYQLQRWALVKAGVRTALASRSLNQEGGADGDLLTPEQAWQDLVEKDDRNSPSEYPEMALITFEELADYMANAISGATEDEPSRCPKCESTAPHMHPAVQHGGEVELCTHDFHLTKTPQNTNKYIDAVRQKQSHAPSPDAGAILRELVEAQPAYDSPNWNSDDINRRRAAWARARAWVEEQGK